jgi:hypothetical protein
LQRVSLEVLDAFAWLTDRSEVARQFEFISLRQNKFLMLRFSNEIDHRQAADARDTLRTRRDDADAQADDATPGMERERVAMGE